MEAIKALGPLLLYGAAVLVVAGGMIGLSALLGQKHRDKETGEPYESGAPLAGSARLRFPAGFYLVAILFVLFDLETVFLLSWAVAFREAGWRGYFGLLVFVGILLAVLAYEWRSGAFNFALKGRDVLAKVRRPGAGGPP